MKILEIEKQLETTDRIEYKGKCHDCDKGVKVRIFRGDKGAIVIEGGAVYNPLSTAQIFLKCDGCFAKNPILQDYQPCEVFSRVVGYIRPVSGWNKGKIEEFRQRKDFIIGEKKEWI